VVSRDHHGDVGRAAHQDARGPQIRVVVSRRSQADRVADRVVAADVVVQDLVVGHVEPRQVAVDRDPGDAVAGQVLHCTLHVYIVCTVDNKE